MTTHDFTSSLAYSHQQADEPWWQQVYERAFPDMAAMVDLRHNGWHQRAGRDRAIMLTSGRTIYVDEKARDRAGGDILLEIWSVYPKDAAPPYPPCDGAKAGWAREPKDCDWLAYAFVPTRVCHLFPFLGVRAALENRRAEWLVLAEKEERGFRWVKASNRTYDTISIVVPTDILCGAITDAMTIGWGS